MNDHGYRPGGGPGLRWGCATTLIVGVPLLVSALGGAAMGHCAPGASCPAGWQLLGGAVLIAVLCGLAVGASVNVSRRD